MRSGLVGFGCLEQGSRGLSIVYSCAESSPRMLQANKVMEGRLRTTCGSWRVRVGWAEARRKGDKG